MGSQFHKSHIAQKATLALCHGYPVPRKIAQKIPRLMSKKYKNKTCVYCTNVNSSQTGDHILAREFFLENQRDNLPKVPACNDCNNEKSELEHYLTAILPFSGRHADSKENLVRMVPPRLEKNKKLHATLSANSGTIWGRFNGLILPHHAIPFDYEKMQKLLTFIVKGLSAHYFKIIIPKEYFVGTIIPNIRAEEPLSGMFGMTSEKRVKKSLGNGTIELEGAQSDTEIYTSIWKICIYGGLTLIDKNTQQQGAFWAYGLTLPERPKDWASG